MKKNIVMLLALGITISIAFRFFTARHTSAEADNLEINNMKGKIEKVDTYNNISKMSFEEVPSLEGGENGLDNSNTANNESRQQKAYEVFGLKPEDMGIHNVELSSLEQSEKNEALIALSNLKKTGSLSGGVQTTEFDESMINVAKDNFNAMGKDTRACHQLSQITQETR